MGVPGLTGSAAVMTSEVANQQKPAISNFTRDRIVRINTFATVALRPRKAIRQKKCGHPGRTSPKINEPALLTEALAEIVELIGRAEQNVAARDEFGVLL